MLGFGSQIEIFCSQMQSFQDKVNSSAKDTATIESLQESNRMLTSELAQSNAKVEAQAIEINRLNFQKKAQVDAIVVLQSALLQSPACTPNGKGSKSAAQPACISVSGLNLQQIIANAAAGGGGGGEK